VLRINRRMSRFTQNFADAEQSIMSMLDGAVTNGRVDLLSALPTFEIPSFQQKSVNNKGFAREAGAGMVSSTPVSHLYYSEKNINALHDAIRYSVYNQTNGKYTIGRQSDIELKIVMRSIYLQHSRDTNTDIVGQVRELNAKVLEWVVPEILSNLLQYTTYRRDVSTLPMPLDHAPNMSQKGLNSMELKSFF